MKKLISIVLAIVCMFCVCVSASAVTEVPQHTKDFLAKDAVSISEEDGYYTYYIYTYADGEVVRVYAFDDWNRYPDDCTQMNFAYEEDDGLHIVYGNGITIIVSNFAERTDKYGRKCIFVDEYGWSFTTSGAMAPPERVDFDGNPVSDDTNNDTPTNPTIEQPVDEQPEDNPGEDPEDIVEPEQNWFSSFVKAVVNAFNAVVRFIGNLF